MYPTAHLDNLRQIVRLIAAAGLALMIAAMVVGVQWAVGWATVLMVAAYGLSLAGMPTVDRTAPVYAAFILLMVEMAYASLERRAGVMSVRGAGTRELSKLVALGLVAAFVAAFVLAVASAPVAYGLLVQVAGVGAAAAVLMTLVLLVRQRT